MIRPTKHEELKQNLLVVSSEIIKIIRNRPTNVEDAYQLFRKEIKESTLEKFYDAITFLWILDFVRINDNIIELNKLQDVSEGTLF